MTHEHRRPCISLYNFNNCAAGQHPACPHRILKFACYKHLLSYFIFYFVGSPSLQYNEFLDFPDFQIIDFHHRARSFSKYENQNENQKTLKTRPERPSFRNGLGTVPGVYEATTIALRTPWVLAVSIVVGTFGVIKKLFWRDTLLPSLIHKPGAIGTASQKWNPISALATVPKDKKWPT